jgi:exonuclease III
MKILFWNIQRGGGKRWNAITDSVKNHNPDVIAFCEYRTQPGIRLCDVLSANGWTHKESTNPDASDDGICVLSRIPLMRTDPSCAPTENRPRWLDIELPELGFGLGVLHIQHAGRDTRAKARFWDAVVDAAARRADQPFMFIGDLNTGRRGVDGRAFRCADRFERLSDMGWTDAWRHYNGAALEATWLAQVTRHPFRIDHAFVSPALLRRLRNCYYSHAEREARVSDHSILIVEIE